MQTETGTTTTADGGQRTTGVVIQATDQASDPRVSGTWTVGLTWQGNASGSLAVEYGTSKMTNAGGTWTGTFSGVGWDGGNASDITLWAVGSGGYAGLSYYVHLRTSYSTGELRGLVFRGSPPAR